MTERYYTAGELAKRAGVTVRTVRYYDQEGLLPPAAIGQNNQRLYKESDAEDLARILILKHFGLSLKEIKANREAYRTPAQTADLIENQLESAQEDVQKILERITLLRTLAQDIQNEGTTWSAMTARIDAAPNKGEQFWRLTSVNDDVHANSTPEEMDQAARAARWHEIIAEAMRLMHMQGAASPEARKNLGIRYRALRDESARNGSPHTHENFILMENVPSHGFSDRDFDKLRQSVFTFLESL